MNAYSVTYKMYKEDNYKYVSLLARNKADAYDRAVYQVIPKYRGEMPYSAWVTSVTYQNGNCHYFNTCEGNPY